MNSLNQKQKEQNRIHFSWRLRMRSAHVLMGNGSLMEVEGGWKWKVDGSGSLMEVVVDGPNEPP